MYIINRSLGLKPEFGGKYLPITISNLPLNEVVSNYLSVLVELTHTSDNKKYTLDIKDLSPELQASTLSLAQWLSINPTLALPTTEGPIKLGYAYVNYYDAWLYDFQITPGNRSYHPSMEISDDLKIDLNLTKSTANYWNMGKYCLFTVNGMLHRSDANDSGVLIFDGAESAKIADDIQVGFLDFQHIGEIEVIPITESMIHKRGNLKLQDGAYIKLPKSTVGKVPLLVMGGHLHALDKIYSVVADDLIKVNFREYSWEIKLDDMRSRINVESLGDLNLSNGITDTQILWSDAVLTKLLTLSQSFIVLVTTNELHREEIALEYSALPGVYYSRNKPIYPIFIGNNRLVEFRAEHQHGVYAINVGDYLSKLYTRETTGYKAGYGFTNQCLPTTPSKPAVAKQLLLSKVLRG